VDDRERCEAVLGELERSEAVQLTRKRLRVGDYEVAGTFCFERKSELDFVQSLVDGRLFQQAAALREGTLRPVYLVEGEGKLLGSERVSRAAIQGAWIALTLIFDIPVLRSLDPRESARLMVYTGGQWSRKQTERVNRFLGRTPKRIRGKALQVVQSLPGVGPDRALSLVRTFGTVREVFGARAEALCRVDGIGKTTARKIERVLEEPF